MPPARNEHDLDKLRETLGVGSKDVPLLSQALTHRSFAHEHDLTHLDSNERLEFLGDAIIGALTAEFLYLRFPGKTEGDLTRLRAALVRKEQLCEFAQAAGLGPLLRLGKGEEANNGRERDSILASGFEAVIGALLLDTTFAHVKILPYPSARSSGRDYPAHCRRPQRQGRNCKSTCRRSLTVKPTYRVLDAQGADHAPIYVVGVYQEEILLATGEGSSTQKAEKAAAARALAQIESERLLHASHTHRPIVLMYLTQLEIHGFKTFPNRTKLAFPEGIAAIVGPNGSGKSNLADAIRWALGEQSMLALRGRKSEDVVFAGTPRRARGSMTEVALTFDNEDGTFPLELAEISIARRAYRSGENEYLLNGNRVRLRDIQQLLADAGIGQGMMIGQGLVDQVLAQRPEDRRVLLEEAAGVRSLYMQEHEAENKLNRVYENMNRVRDILLELEPRLTVLETQAREAQRAESLQQELAQVLHDWYAAQLAQIVAEEAAAASELEQVRATLTTLAAQIASQEAERQHLEQALGEHEQGMQRLVARVGGLRNRLRDLAQRQAVQQERQTHLRRNVAEVGVAGRRSRGTVRIGRRALAPAGNRLDGSSRGPYRPASGVALAQKTESRPKRRPVRRRRLFCSGCGRKVLASPHG